MDGSGRHVDEHARAEGRCSVIQNGAAATPVDQQDLMQAGMAVGHQFPVVQLRTGLDGFAVNHIGQVAGLAEQVVVENGGLAGVWHVRFVQEISRRVHFNGGGE